MPIVNRYTSWEELESSIRICTRCPLHRYRKNVVPGEGPKNSMVMIVGEAPGATEDEMGRPFVGAAGKLLTLTLESVGIKREDVYITNVVKCRPPQNREPNDDEIESCSIYLESQILLLKPRVITTLGNIAGRKIFSLGSKPWEGIMKMRGRVYTMDVLGVDTYVIPTIHPAAALYNPSLRSILLNDLKQLSNLLTSISTSKYIEDRKGGRTIMDYIKRK